MAKRIEIYRVPVKEHERTYVRITDEPEYEQRKRPGPFDIPDDPRHPLSRKSFKDAFRHMGF